MGVRSARLSGPRGSVNYSAGTRQDHAGMDAPLNAPLTAPLAIWYLYHLSLQEGPADVTVPKERSRRFHYQRDENLPMPSVKEERAAKRIRGWVWPGERFSVKEKEM
ncbi:hypothetical protein K470DRAFT_254635 [Piedraia hortae CBS 480.64]|uniref:Uncharacterized protein n=1 Tax=Piedraia hortae CBS 480.64 TaxID=1314780 RepID=A0A6A7C918_9PEZI|nr:hypothetical protein K470DRAFT_254635 [Piedraia hortae CBS 480.64]